MREKIHVSRLERAVAPEALPPEAAVQLRRVDLASEPGSASRGRGQVKAGFTTGLAAAVNGAWQFTRRDGTAVQIGSTDGGVLFAQVAPTAAYEDEDYA